MTNCLLAVFPPMTLVQNALYAVTLGALVVTVQWFFLFTFRRRLPGKHAKLLVTCISICGGLVGVVTGPLTLPPDWLEHWIGFIISDALERCAVGAVLGMIVGALAVICGRIVPEPPKGFWAWFFFGATTAFLLCFLAGPLPLPGSWRPESLGYTWFVALRRGAIGAIIGSVVALLLAHKGILRTRGIISENVAPQPELDWASTTKVGPAAS